MSLDGSGNVQVEVVLGRLVLRLRMLQFLNCRRLLGTVLTVYIPTVLLVIISYMSNFFKPFFFEAVVSVNLTVMLVRLF